MPLPGSEREKQFLSEVAETKVAPAVVTVAPTFLQEIKEPTHEHEELLEETSVEAPTKKKKKRWKK
jgi:hypothetical protein